MKFFDCKTAPSPRRVRIFLAEKGVDVETVQVDLRAGEQLSEEFRAINPDCTVPALQLDDGSCISEATAICQFFEEFQPEPTLWGRDAAERARATMWNAKIEQQGLLGMAEALRNSSERMRGRALPGPDNYEQIPALAERGRARVAAFLTRLDAQLAGQEFVCGDLYTIADITALVLVDFAAWLKISPPDSASHLQRWHQAVSARPSASA